MKIYGFDWDRGNILKCQKHGLSVEDVEFCFEHSRCRIENDPKHSDTEDRYFVIGQTQEKRYCFIAFTYRLKNGTKLIRPISARYMHDKEVKYYETKITKTKIR